MPSQKIQKIGKCHETDKNPTKSDEIWSIWSQTGQGNLFRGVPDPKKIQKMSNFGIWAHFGPFLSLSSICPELKEQGLLDFVGDGVVAIPKMGLRPR